MKNLYFIRHGKSSHNIFFDMMGDVAYTDIIHTDSSLVEEGFNQCNNLVTKYKNFFDKIFTSDDYLIIVSPMKRCIMTLLVLLRQLNYKINKEEIICSDYIREYPCGIHTTNRRMTKKTLEEFYGSNINFDYIIHDNDIYWNKEREETIEELKIRSNNFKQWINNFKQKNIIIISHSSFISNYLFNDVNHKTEHEKIYNIKHNTDKM